MTRCREIIYSKSFYTAWKLELRVFAWKPFDVKQHSCKHHGRIDCALRVCDNIFTQIRISNLSFSRQSTSDSVAIEDKYPQPDSGREK